MSLGDSEEGANAHHYYLRRLNGLPWRLHDHLSLLLLLQVHSNGIYHGDVRPPNMVTNGDQAVLIDWGLAGKFSSERQRSQVFGNSAFVSTSILTAVSQKQTYLYQSHDDLEALGYSLENLLSGALAWSGQRSQNILEMRKDYPFDTRIQLFLNEVQSSRDRNPNYDKLMTILAAGLELDDEETIAQESVKSAEEEPTSNSECQPHRRMPIPRRVKKKIDYRVTQRNARRPSSH